MRKWICVKISLNSDTKGRIVRVVDVVNQLNFLLRTVVRLDFRETVRLLFKFITGHGL